MRKLKRNLSKETDYWLGAPRGIPQRFVHLPVLSMYSLTISSVMFPELTARYPLAQTCRPQNLPCRRCGNSCSSTRELIPLSHCIIWLTSWLGRYPTNTCTWSRATFPEMISNSCAQLRFAGSNPAPELLLLSLKRAFGISVATPNAL